MSVILGKHCEGVALLEFGVILRALMALLERWSIGQDKRAWIGIGVGVVCLGYEWYEITEAPSLFYACR